MTSTNNLEFTSVPREYYKAVYLKKKVQMFGAGLEQDTIS